MKWQCLGGRIFEDNVEAGPFRFSVRPRNHLRRRVDPVDNARRPDTPLGRDGKGARSAAYIQDRVSRLKRRQVENLFPKERLPAKCHEPNGEVIESRPVQDQAGRPRRQTLFADLWHIALLAAGRSRFRHLSRLSLKNKTKHMIIDVVSGILLPDKTASDVLYETKTPLRL